MGENIRRGGGSVHFVQGDVDCGGEEGGAECDADCKAGNRLGVGSQPNDDARLHPWSQGIFPSIHQSQ